MRERERLNSVQRELEAALASVVPAAAHVDPIAAAFDAGHKSGRRQVRFWRAAAAMVLAIGLGIRLIPLGRDPVAPTHDQPGTNVAFRASDTANLPEQSLLMLEKAVKEKGVDGLPAAHLWRAEILNGNGTM